MRSLNHFNIIEIKDSGFQTLKNSSTEKEVYFIALEYATKGELIDFIYSTGKFEEKVARYFFRELIEGLNYMHENRICHRDLKCQNILLDSKFNLKIADFGGASYKKKNTTFIGTQEFMAPEILKGREYNGKL